MSIANRFVLSNLESPPRSKISLLNCMRYFVLRVFNYNLGRFAKQVGDGVCFEKSPGFINFDPLKKSIFLYSLQTEILGHFIQKSKIFLYFPKTEILEQFTKKVL